MDSNHRTRKRADLQSAAVGHLATCPFLSHLSESNQRPTDYKSVALPAELKWQILKLFLASNQQHPDTNWNALPDKLKWQIISKLHSQIILILNVLLCIKELPRFSGWQR